MTIDIDAWREDLINYYGTAMSSYPIAMMDLINVETASDEEIVDIAIQNGFDLSDYEIIEIKSRI